MYPEGHELVPMKFVDVVYVFKMVKTTLQELVENGEPLLDVDVCPFT